MKFGKVFSMILLVGWLAIPGLAWSAELVIGKNLKPGMALNEAIKLLGIPESITLHRGPEPTLDSLEINYAKHGVLIRSLNEGKKVEAIEISPSFQGKFDSGLKLGEKFPQIIKLYGVPKSLTSQVMRYPDRGIYFLLNGETLLSAKTFAKDTKLIHHKMMNP